MAQAIVKRTMKKMMIMDSSKLLLSRKTFISNSHNQLTTKLIKSFPPPTTTNLFRPSATTRNFFSQSSLFSQYSSQHQHSSANDNENLFIPIKYRPWIAAPLAILVLIGGLECLATPYCRPKPVVDREDHVRYCFKLEKGVRQEDVKFKIVDDSVLELSYMYRHFPSPRIVNKDLPKGNYANAEIRGWLNKRDVFMVDIAGFQRQPTKNHLSHL